MRIQYCEVNIKHVLCVTLALSAESADWYWVKNDVWRDYINPFPTPIVARLAIFAIFGLETDHLCDVW